MRLLLGMIAKDCLNYMMIVKAGDEDVEKTEPERTLESTTRKSKKVNGSTEQKKLG